MEGFTHQPANYVGKRASEGRPGANSVGETLAVTELGPNYRELQKHMIALTAEIAQIEADLERGNQHIAPGNDRLRELAIQLGREAHQKLEAKQAEKNALDRQIEAARQALVHAGEDPSHYAVQ